VKTEEETENEIITKAMRETGAYDKSKPRKKGQQPYEDLMAKISVGLKNGMTRQEIADEARVRIGQVSWSEKLLVANYLHPTKSWKIQASENLKSTMVRMTKSSIISKEPEDLTSKDYSKLILWMSEMKGHAEIKEGKKVA
tara:strand:- start:3 stop:425 length:423 start_codon:yes stop_codon:yes gene_type:complete